MAQTSRLIFANQLRGLAALCVVAAHLIAVYWSDSVGLGTATATATPPISGTPPFIYQFVAWPSFNFGPFGVAVFFLISGLVIPISLARHSTTSFLLARVLRIFPTVIVALILEIVVVRTNHYFWGLPIPFGRIQEFANAFLFYDLIGRGSIDLVNWTLCVELKFYLLMAFMAGPIQRGRLLPLFAVALAITAGNLLYAQFDLAAPEYAPIRMMSLGSVFIIFMLVGVLFNYHVRGLLTLPGLAASIAAMLAFFALAWHASFMSRDLMSVASQYLYGLILFSLAYALRRFAIRITVLDWLAAISFPLYLIHLIFGVSLLKFLTLEVGLPYMPALGLTLAIIIGIATLLHLGIERHSTGWGNRLAVVPSLA